MSSGMGRRVLRLERRAAGGSSGGRKLRVIELPDGAERPKAAPGELLVIIRQFALSDDEAAA